MTLIIFDIDGTLTDTKEADDFCFAKAVKCCWGIELGKSIDWAKFTHVTDSGIAKEIYQKNYGRELSSSELLRFKNSFFVEISRYSKNNPKAFQQIQGATQFLKKLSERGILIAFATGGWKFSAAFKLSKVGIDLNEFPNATSDDHDDRKEIVLKAIKRAEKFYDKPISQSICIGDGIWDYMVAKNLELKFIGIDSKNQGHLKQNGISDIFSNYADTEIFLRKLQY